MPLASSTARSIGRRAAAEGDFVFRVRGLCASIPKGNDSVWTGLRIRRAPRFGVPGRSLVELFRLPHRMPKLFQ